MSISKNEFVLYGLDNYTYVIEEIIDELKAREYEFDFKMILSETIANAYYHGNKNDDSLPIYVRYSMSNGVVTLEIEDCGMGIEDINKLLTLDATDILKENSRGLFLVSCYAEKIEYRESVIKIEKILCKKE